MGKTFTHFDSTYKGVNFGSTYHKGIEDYHTCKSFDDIYKDIAPSEGEAWTMLDVGKLRTMYELAVAVNVYNVEGDVAEAGVWYGGCLYMLASTLEFKICHGFDTWEGLPPLAEEDLVDGKSILFEGWGKTEPPTWLNDKFGERIQLHKGLFSDTFDNVKAKKFCLVHIDSDLYVSIKESMEFFVPRMSEGGFIIVDDYTFHLCPGAKKAVDEYFNNHGHSYKRVILGKTVTFAF